jgi:hypothetical protein
MLKPPRVGEILAGAFGALLLVSLFLPWYRAEAPACVGGSCPEAPQTSAWEAFAALDLLLLITALAGIGLLAVEVTLRSPAIPVAWSAVTALLGVVASGLVLWRTLSPPGGSDMEAVFALLGLGAAIGLTVGCLASMRDESAQEGRSSAEPRAEPLPVPSVPVEGGGRGR